MYMVFLSDYLQVIISMNFIYANRMPDWETVLSHWIVDIDGKYCVLLHTAKCVLFHTILTEGAVIHIGSRQ